ncbi:protein kinase [Candidatus Uabimicrobium sp. HlEnr_7]|uniref:protein kinase domain-containing protein n=1 Tax=Candidatus Uabimicrobium helgolandensis TaxID=3095367 RepID=UPI003558DE05
MAEEPEPKNNHQSIREKTIELSSQQTSERTMFILKTKQIPTDDKTVITEQSNQKRILDEESSAQTVVHYNEHTIANSVEEDSCRDHQREQQACPTEIIQNQINYAQEASNKLDWKSIKSGDRIGRYEIQKKIGIGGMGAVFKAFDSTLQRAVAIKLVLGISNNERFLIEAQTTAKLNHANIVSLYDIVKLGEDSFAMVMEYIDGKTLAEVLRDENIIEEKRALHIVRDVAQALQNAHKMHIVHRDIKPGNIMIDSQNIVKVTDFGLAKMLSSEQDVQVTQPNMILGTPVYMPPEQIQGEVVDGKSDVYSLGVTFYQLLSGKLPILSSDLMEILATHIKNDLIPLEEIKPEIAHTITHIVNGMLIGNRDKRWDTQSVISAINTYLDSASHSVNRSTQREVVLENHFFTQHMNKGQQYEEKNSFCDAIFEYQKAFEKRPAIKAPAEKIEILQSKVINDINQKMKLYSWREALDLCNKMKELFPNEREIMYLHKICEESLKNKALKKKLVYASVAVAIVLFLVLLKLTVVSDHKDNDLTAKANKNDNLTRNKNANLQNYKKANDSQKLMLSNLSADKKWNIALQNKQQQKWTQAIYIFGNMLKEPKYEQVRLKIKQQIEECLAQQCIGDAQKCIERKQWQKAATLYANAFEHSPSTTKSFSPLQKSKMFKEFAGKASRLENEIAQKNWAKLRTVFWNMNKEQQKLFIVHYRAQLKDIPAPQIDFSIPTQISVEEKVSFVARVSQKSHPNIHLTWNFGNGETKSGANVYYTYYKPGKFIVTLSIDDGINHYKKILDHYNIKAAVTSRIAWKMQELENGFYEFNVEEDVANTFYTWKFADGNIRCGKRVRYKFSYSGKQQVQLVVVSGESRNTTKRKVNILYADPDLEHRKIVYHYVQKLNKSTKNSVVDLPGKVMDARLALGGAYVILRLQDSRRLKLYDLVQRKFLESFAMPDVNSIFSSGGRYLVCYSKNNNLFTTYDYVSQKTRKYKDFKHKISDLVMGLDNGRFAFVTILDKNIGRENQNKYALMDLTTFNISNFDVKNLRYAGRKYIQWRSDAYLYNLTCHQSNSSPWGVNWIYLNGSDLTSKDKHTTLGYLPLGLEGNYIFTSQGTILKGNPESQFHRERSHIFPIYGSSYYINYKKGKHYRDPGVFQIKDVYTLDVLKELREGQAITDHPYHVKDFHYIASAISDTMIQIKKNKMYVFSLGINHN